MTPRVVPVETKVLNENQRIAAELRERFARAGTLVVNLISSPGSGKTRLLERTLELLVEDRQSCLSGQAGLPVLHGTRAAVLTGDIQTDADATRLARFGFPVRQITTGGTCHLDAKMIERHLEGWNLDELDLLFIENVGNLVCPSSYDLGEEAKIVLLSVTEGEEKPLKYPSIFFKSKLILITKVDLLPYVPFQFELAVENARRINADAQIIGVSCQSDEGLREWLHWLGQRICSQARPHGSERLELADAPGSALR
ncbi:MAG TPA: hydrogenase nickel incorporation protein HypB [Thermoanaerobaculia bacterium]|nr:hydrogenase nickel incorporation protein HypB [Thermoanaerobaculia bacterium]